MRCCPSRPILGLTTARQPIHVPRRITLTAPDRRPPLAGDLCIGAWIIGPQVARDVIETFLAAEFSTQAHFRRRVDKLGELEREAARALVEGRRFP